MCYILESVTWHTSSDTYEMYSYISTNNTGILKDHTRKLIVMRDNIVDVMLMLSMYYMTTRIMNSVQ